MSNLNIDQKNIRALFQDRKASFLIPDYQRPYAWGTEECCTLWDDLYNFAIPDDNPDIFCDQEEYFLGPIVTFKNDKKKLEIIDGQQRLTTLMLLLRAFYNRLQHMKDKESVAMQQLIRECIWKADDFGEVRDESALKISSEVATDNDKGEFYNILKNGIVGNAKSRYSKNFIFFVDKINNFLNTYPKYFAILPARILNYCVLLPIEAESQDTALRIFSTLNDRGKPLSDADIFKAQFYKYYSSCGKKDEFIATWRDLDEISTAIFRSSSGTPLDELFTRYMHYERAKLSITSSSTESLRKFYEKNNYDLLKKESTLENLVCLAHFWQSISKQDAERFSERILKRLFVLNYAPNSMWTNIVSVYFMHNKDKFGNLQEADFYNFLNIITAFVWAYAITNPGVNSLRTPVYAEMVNIVNGGAVTFKSRAFDEQQFRKAFELQEFTNYRTITKSLLTWWAFSFEQQPLLPLDTCLDIEHICSRNRQRKENGLTIEMIESLGNKSLLERNINIGASDYRFEDKKKYYKGNVASKSERKATKIHELVYLAETYNDFTENDIKERAARILDKFIKYLKNCNLLQ